MDNSVATLSRAESAQVKYLNLPPWALLGIARAVPFKTHSAMAQGAITDLASIVAANALASALGKLEIMETCGRVVLVAVEEHRVPRDPVIPLALVSLGRRYDRAFANYACHLARFHTDQGWWNKASKLCARVIDALEAVSSALSASEFSYLVVKLQVPLAWPQGREAMSNA